MNYPPPDEIRSESCPVDRRDPQRGRFARRQLLDGRRREPAVGRRAAADSECGPNTRVKPRSVCRRIISARPRESATPAGSWIGFASTARRRMRPSTSSFNPKERLLDFSAGPLPGLAPGAADRRRPTSSQTSVSSPLIRLLDRRRRHGASGLCQHGVPADYEPSIGSGSTSPQDRPARTGELARNQAEGAAERGANPAFSIPTPRRRLLRGNVYRAGRTGRTGSPASSVADIPSIQGTVHARVPLCPARSVSTGDVRP